MTHALRLAFRKNCIRCDAQQFFASYFLFEQFAGNWVILGGYPIPGKQFRRKRAAKNLLYPYFASPLVRCFCGTGHARGRRKRAMNRQWVR